MLPAIYKSLFQRFYTFYTCILNLLLFHFIFLGLDLCFSWKSDRDIARKVLILANSTHRSNFCSFTSNGGQNSAENKVDYNDTTMSRNKTELHDIAIVGGGMVGLALACALSIIPLARQLRVAIIDNNPSLLLRDNFKQDAIPDPRVSTLTPSTISFFKEIGAWEHVQQQRHAFFDQMQVWDYTGYGYTRYNARDVGKDCLGCVVENKAISNSLLHCLQNTDFEKKVYSARLSSMIFQSYNSSPERTASNLAEGNVLSSGKHDEKVTSDSIVMLNLSDGDSLYAKLVVGADGSNSQVRNLVGIKTTGWKYSQSALICTVEHANENHCAWQRFLPSGPIALLPIGDRFSNIVWTMNPEEASNHKSMSKADFVASANSALNHGYGSHPRPSFLDEFVDKFSSILGQDTPSTKEPFQVPPEVIDVVSERAVFPLSLMHARDYVSKRVVLIGDAAHAVHPLAGQGVNLGFQDTQTLSKVIADGLLVGADIGEASLLRKYERERKASNVVMMAILDSFQKAYSVDLGPVNFLRAAAFHGAQYIAPLKKNIISYAMGEQRWPLFI